MKGIILTSLMVVGILLFAGTAIGLSYAKYDEATTTIIVEDGLKCCVDGKEITGKSTITTNLKGGYLKVCVESEKPAVIGYYGVWYNDVDKQTREGQSSEEVTSYSIDIPFNHGKYDGSLVIRNMGSEAYGAPIHMKIHFDESKIKVWFSFANSYRHDGDVVTALGDCVFDVSTVDGMKHTIKWEGSWGNDQGDHGDLNGVKIEHEVEIRISSFYSVHGPSSGEITFTLMD